MNLRLWQPLCLAALLVAPALSASPAGLADLLEPVRARHHLPAMGAAVIDTSGLVTQAVVGVRKAGSPAPATIADCWHLGSDTKAMTATMLATLVQDHRIAWTSTLGQVFADVVPDIPAPAASITLLDLLHHRSGLPANLDWHHFATREPLPEQRLDVVREAVHTPLQSAPGQQFSYSNLGYVVAGAMAEHVTGEPWETLITQRVFGPLHMQEQVGFGPCQPLGTLGIEEPWGHTPEGEPNNTDNPLVMAPAGCAHMALSSWALFISDQLRGARGEAALLRTESYRTLQTPPPGGDYACGWICASRPWAGGLALTHEGSNTVNVADVWIAPQRGFACLDVTNEGGPEASKACDEAIFSMIQAWQGGALHR